MPHLMTIGPPRAETYLREFGGLGHQVVKVLGLVNFGEYLDIRYLTDKNNNKIIIVHLLKYVLIF